MMGIGLYNEIRSTIQSQQNIRDCQTILEEKYPMISTMTLGSILGNYVTRKMKATHSKHTTPDKIQEYYQRYTNSVSVKEAPGIILRLADEINICAVLVARFILEAYLREQQEREIRKYNSQMTMSDCSNTSKLNDESSTEEGPTQSSSSSTGWTVLRQEVSRLLRDTTQIEDRDLAYEVYLCTVHDDHYGPIPDAIKQSIGAEYEQILKEKLSNLEVWFVDESILRKQGYDKTPDFKLEVPIAVSGCVINWIESKATFGDEETHQTYLDEQLMSYWNRYGPGLVIYWLGFVDTLKSKTAQGILIKDQLPSNIVRMNPTRTSECQLVNEADLTKVDTQAVKALDFGSFS